MQNGYYWVLPFGTWEHGKSDCNIQTSRKHYSILEPILTSAELEPEPKDHQSHEIRVSIGPSDGACLSAFKAMSAFSKFVECCLLLLFNNAAATTTKSQPGASKMYIVKVLLWLETQGGVC